MVMYMHILMNIKKLVAYEYAYTGCCDQRRRALKHHSA